MQLGFVVPRGVLKEPRRDDPVSVPELAAVRRMVTCPDVSGFRLDVLKGFLRAGHNRLLDAPSPPGQAIGCLHVAGLLRLDRRGEVTGERHRDRLLSRMGDVEERHEPPHPLALLEPDLPLVLGVGQVPEVGQPRRDGVLYPLLQGPHVVLRLALRGVQWHAIRADVVVVQRPHLVRVNLPGQAERLGALTPPEARRLFPAAVVAGSRRLQAVVSVVPLVNGDVAHTSPAADGFKII